MIPAAFPSLGSAADGPDFFSAFEAGAVPGLGPFDLAWPTGSTVGTAKIWVANPNVSSPATAVWQRERTVAEVERSMRLGEVPGSYPPAN